jgi:hypothetical protein
MTPGRAAIARALFRAGLLQHDIATLLCCNQGRISEAIQHEEPLANLQAPETKLLIMTSLARAVLRMTRDVDDVLGEP